MDFATIERQRRAAGLTQRELCQAAAVHPMTYVRLKKRPASGLARTYARLQQAVADLSARRARALRSYRGGRRS